MSDSKSRRVVYWLIIAGVFSFGLALMWGSERVPFASVKVLMAAVGVVACTSIAYRFLYDLVVKKIEQESILQAIRETVQSAIVGNRVRAYARLDAIDEFEVRLSLAKRSLTCCGPTLINISRKLPAIENKLTNDTKFKIDILMLSPGVGNITKALLKANMSEPELENHLTKSYQSFLKLKQTFPTQVEIYQFHSIPMFSLLGFDMSTENAYVSARHYINGRYPPDCPGLELASTNDMEKYFIDQHKSGIDYLARNSVKVECSTPEIEYWDTRARVFENLDWPKTNQLLSDVVELCQLQQRHRVVELGSGTGIIASMVAQKCKQYVGLDLSSEMIRIAYERNHAGAAFMYADVTKELPCDTASVDVVIARMILHHLVGDLERTLRECWRVLRPSGVLVVCENIPLSARSRSFFERCFQIKERRVVMEAEEWLEKLTSLGFSIAEQKTNDVSTSLENWINNNCLSDRAKGRLRKLFTAMSKEEEDEYEISRRAEDVFFRSRYLLVRAVKPS